MEKGILDRGNRMCKAKFVLTNESHRRCSEIVHVQIFAVGNILLGVSVKKGPEGDLGSRRAR